MAPSRYNLGANELASMLSGSTLPIPNLKLPLANFSKGTNKYADEIRRWVDKLIDESVNYYHSYMLVLLTQTHRNIQDGRKCTGVKRCDFGYLAAW